MMYNIGDKFIIEIGGTFNAWISCKEEWNKDHDSTLYRIKGFRSLVFDENGLNKLEKYEEKKEPETKWIFSSTKEMNRCMSCPSAMRSLASQLGSMVGAQSVGSSMGRIRDEVV